MVSHSLWSLQSFAISALTYSSSDACYICFRTCYGNDHANAAIGIMQLSRHLCTHAELQDINTFCSILLGEKDCALGSSHNCRIYLALLSMLVKTVHQARDVSYLLLAIGDCKGWNLLTELLTYLIKNIKFSTVSSFFEACLHQY